MKGDIAKDAASIDVGGLLEQAAARGAPALRALLARIGEQGDQALDAKAIDLICGHIHPLLPFPVRMIVKKDRLATLIAANRDRVLAAARRAGRTGP